MMWPQPSPWVWPLAGCGDTRRSLWGTAGFTQSPSHVFNSTAMHCTWTDVACLYFIQSHIKLNVCKTKLLSWSWPDSNSLKVLQSPKYIQGKLVWQLFLDVWEVIILQKNPPQHGSRLQRGAMWKESWSATESCTFDPSSPEWAESSSSSGTNSQSNRTTRQLLWVLLRLFEKKKW